MRQKRSSSLKALYIARLGIRAVVRAWQQRLYKKDLPAAHPRFDLRLLDRNQQLFRITGRSDEKRTIANRICKQKTMLFQKVLDNRGINL